MSNAHCKRCGAMYDDDHPHGCFMDMLDKLPDEGIGTDFENILRTFGLTSCSKCKRLKYWMNLAGPKKVKEHINWLTDEVEKNAKSKNARFSRTACKLMLHYLVIRKNTLDKLNTRSSS